jgi:hypothetical protein
MDVRIVETLPMSGALSDPFYKLDGTKEGISLDWSYVNNSFDLIDRNIDYSKLPVQLATFDVNGNLVTDGLVKKAFLTYNSISCQTKEIIETVVMESANEASPIQAPGYCNSNEWVYQPENFRLSAELQNGLSNDLLTWPYPWTEGVTLVKTFLNSQSNTVQPLYTAYYRRPTMTTFELANVEGAKVHTDGWYSSYIVAVKTYLTASPDPNIPLSCSAGMILYYNNAFYVNLTGTCIELGSLFITDPLDPMNTVDAALPEYDTINWSGVPTFQQWMDFLKSNYYDTFSAGGMNQNNFFNGTLSQNINNGYSATLNQSTSSASSNVGLIGDESPSSIVTAMDRCYYSECNHLATPELNAAILLELKQLCGCCADNKFGMSHVETWIKLQSKRNAAYIYFEEDNFKEAQAIIISSRPHCTVNLSNKSCNIKFGSSCC